MHAFGRQQEIYPATFAEDSIDTYLARHGRMGRAIYLAVIGIVVLAGALLPVIHVQPSVRSAGVIRPAVEKHDVRARTSGVVAAVRLRENAMVREGDTLLVLRSAALGERRDLLVARADERRRFVHDLERLAHGALPVASPETALQTPTFRKEHASFTIALAEFAPRLEQATRELVRARSLRAQGFITQSEVDDRAFALARAESERATLLARFVADWESRLATNQVELATLETERRQLTEETSLYAVVAPVTGTVEQIASVSPGSFLAGADRLAVISPTSTLLADVDVRPRDIGLLRVGMPVRLRIDAFDASDWGFVSGRIAEIASDVTPVNGQPTFRVRVSLDQSRLTLRTGFVGQLKKGMTLQARFLLAERSLWQLLFDDVNDWLDPTRGVPTSTVAAADADGATR
jgi:multidrug resistance efflux pump